MKSTGVCWYFSWDSSSSWGVPSGYFRVGLPLTALTLTWGIIWLSLVR
jgi:hypothetical protein